MFTLTIDTSGPEFDPQRRTLARVLRAIADRVAEGAPFGGVHMTTGAPSVGRFDCDGPDMLAALKPLAEHAATIKRRHEDAFDIAPTMWRQLYALSDEARTAIAKAEGRS